LQIAEHSEQFEVAESLFVNAERFINEVMQCPQCFSGRIIGSGEKRGELKPPALQRAAMIAACDVRETAN